MVHAGFGAYNKVVQTESLPVITIMCSVETHVYHWVVFDTSDIRSLSVDSRCGHLDCRRSDNKLGPAGKKNDPQKT